MWLWYVMFVLFSVTSVLYFVAFDLCLLSFCSWFPRKVLRIDKIADKVQKKDRFQKCGPIWPGVGPGPWQWVCSSFGMLWVSTRVQLSKDNMILVAKTFWLHNCYENLMDVAVLHTMIRYDTCIWWYCKCPPNFGLDSWVAKGDVPHWDGSYVAKAISGSWRWHEGENDRGESWGLLGLWEIWNVIRSFGMNDWITILQFHCWYDTTEVEIPLNFKKFRDVGNESKHHARCDKLQLLLGLCRYSWRDVEGNWSWHCTCRCYMLYKLYALYRVFRHRFEYPEHRVHNQMNYM